MSSNNGVQRGGYAGNCTSDGGGTIDKTAYPPCIATWTADMPVKMPVHTAAIKATVGATATAASGAAPGVATEAVTGTRGEDGAAGVTVAVAVINMGENTTTVETDLRSLFPAAEEEDVEEDAKEQVEQVAYGKQVAQGKQGHGEATGDNVRYTVTNVWTGQATAVVGAMISTELRPHASALYSVVRNT